MSTIRVTGEGRGLYKRLTIGQGSFVGTDAMFNLSDKIVIGQNVSIGPHVRIYTSSHEIGPSERRRSYSVEHRPVMIGDGSWVCVGATILPGVIIGAGSIVAAGSVVTHDVEPNTLVSGVPAAFVKKLSLQRPERAGASLPSDLTMSRRPTNR